MSNIGRASACSNHFRNRTGEQEEPEFTGSGAREAGKKTGTSRTEVLQPALFLSSHCRRGVRSRRSERPRLVVLLAGDWLGRHHCEPGLPTLQSGESL